jgi:hypothetical protein
MLSVVAEIDFPGTAATVGYSTTTELLRAVGRVSLGEARARVAAAADVLPGCGLNGAPVEPKLRLPPRQSLSTRSAPPTSR